MGQHCSGANRSSTVAQIGSVDGMSALRSKGVFRMTESWGPLKRKPVANSKYFMYLRACLNMNQLIYCCAPKQIARSITWTITAQFEL